MPGIYFMKTIKGFHLKNYEQQFKKYFCERILFVSMDLPILKSIQNNSCYLHILSNNFCLYRYSGMTDLPKNKQKCLKAPLID